MALKPSVGQAAAPLHIGPQLMPGTGASGGPCSHNDHSSHEQGLTLPLLPGIFSLLLLLFRLLLLCDMTFLVMMLQALEDRQCQYQ